jgi:hypothetical protein
VASRGEDGFQQCDNRRLALRPNDANHPQPPRRMIDECVAELAKRHPRIVDMVHRYRGNRQQPLRDHRRGAAIDRLNGVIVAVRCFVQDGDKRVAWLNFPPIAGATGNGRPVRAGATGAGEQRVQSYA